LTLPSLFLTTVIFMNLSWGTRAYFFSGTDGTSSSHGHAAIVFTWPLVFLMIVIFMIQTLPL